MATIRQKKAFDKIVENRGASVSGAMREAGYPEVTARNPKNLTESKGFKELIEEYLPDSLLGQKHQELLMKTDEKGEIDVQAVKSGLDMAYKIKGSYAPVKGDITSDGERIVFAPIAVIGRLKENNEERIRVTPEANGSNQLPQEI